MSSANAHLWTNTATVSESFVDPTTRQADFDHWAQLTTWSNWEAAILLLGWDPVHFSGTSIPPAAQSAWVEKFERLRMRIERASIRRTGEASGPPTEFIKWADDNEVAVPAGLRTAVEKIRPTRSQSQDQELSPRVRNTLLKLILGMAIDAYSHNPTAARSPTARIISERLAQLGVQVSDDTVHAYLQEAAEAVDLDLLSFPKSERRKPNSA